MNFYFAFLISDERFTTTDINEAKEYLKRLYADLQDRPYQSNAVFVYSMRYGIPWNVDNRVARFYHNNGGTIVKRK